MLPEYEGFDPEEVDKLIEVDLSSDEEVLNRIEPGNKRKYNLSTNEVVDPGIGYFERSENMMVKKRELDYLTEEINPALKEIIPYVMSKHSQQPIFHFLAKVQEMRQKKHALRLVIPKLAGKQNQ